LICRDWGKARESGMPEQQLRKPSRQHSGLEKTPADGGGSHRRSRSDETAALMYVATKT